MTGAPQRFSEHAFRRYEACIAQVVTQWPTPVVFDPARAQLSLETFTCRLRDAITGAMKYSYTSEDFDVLRLFDIHDELVVAQRDGKVVVGPKEALKSFTPVQPIHAASKGQDVYDLKNPTRAVLEAFCLLLSERLLGKPVVVHLMDPQLLTEMQGKYDIDASLNPDGSVLII